MGLDITAISEIEPIEIPADIEIWSDEYYDWEADQDFAGHVWNLYQSDHFPEQGEGLPNTSVIATGEDFGHRAGSYSGYNEWRRLLAQAALGLTDTEVWARVDAGESYDNIPFGELINFSDADGTIGPVASAKLYNDFVQYEEDVMNRLDRFYLKFEDYEIDGDTYHWFKQKYKDWKETFRVASNNGAVIFH